MSIDFKLFHWIWSQFNQFPRDDLDSKYKFKSDFWLKSIWIRLKPISNSKSIEWPKFTFYHTHRYINLSKLTWTILTEITFFPSKDWPLWYQFSWVFCRIKAMTFLYYKTIQSKINFNTDIASTPAAVDELSLFILELHF